MDEAGAPARHIIQTTYINIYNTQKIGHTEMKNKLKHRTMHKALKVHNYVIYDNKRRMTRVYVMCYREIV